MLESRFNARRLFLEVFSVSFVVDKNFEKNLKFGQNQGHNVLTSGLISKQKKLRKSKKFLLLWFSRKIAKLRKIGRQKCLIFAQEFTKFKISTVEKRE